MFFFKNQHYIETGLFQNKLHQISTGVPVRSALSFINLLSHIRMLKMGQLNDL